MSAKDLGLKFWKTLADNGVLFGPGIDRHLVMSGTLTLALGSIFAASDDWDQPSADGHFRVAFSHASVSSPFATFQLEPNTCM